MSRIQWKNTISKSVGTWDIQCAPTLESGYNQGSGIKKTNKVKFLLKKFLWPIKRLHDDFFVDGFISRNVGRLIAKYIDKNYTTLEVGCGDMSLRKYLPHHTWYNAFDLCLSDFHLYRNLKYDFVNVALASVKDIPVDDNVVDLVFSTEVFEHIPDFEIALSEIYRVLVDGGIMICSIPNNYCNKYVKKGPHPGHINNWTFQEFIFLLESKGFKQLEGHMKGRWLPLPLWLTKISYQFPFTSRLEYLNTNFFFVFKALK
jgi:SAM-dependent methyltransferase